jgi:hypothetical protein
MDRFRPAGIYVSTFPESLYRTSGDGYRSTGIDGLRPFPRDLDRDRGEPGRYESMTGRRGGERPLTGETVDRLRGGGEACGDVDFRGEDLTSKVSEDNLVPFTSSTGFLSSCSAGLSAPLCCGVVFPVSGGDTIDVGYLPEYLNVGNSLYVSIINITASICKHLRIEEIYLLDPLPSHRILPTIPCRWVLSVSSCS